MKHATCFTAAILKGIKERGDRTYHFGSLIGFASHLAHAEALGVVTISGTTSALTPLGEQCYHEWGLSQMTQRRAYSWPRREYALPRKPSKLPSPPSGAPVHLTRWFSSKDYRNRVMNVVAVAADGEIYAFEGRSIPGALHYDEHYRYPGGPHREGTIAAQEGTVVITWMSKDTPKARWPQATQAESFAWVKAQAPHASLFSFRRLRTKRRYAAPAASCSRGKYHP